MSSYQTIPVSLPPNVIKDGSYFQDTETSSFVWTDADGFRFVDGKAQTQGGTVTQALTTSTDRNAITSMVLNGTSINGADFKYIDASGNVYYLIGSGRGLIALKRTLVSGGTALSSAHTFVAYNITPLMTTTIAIANSLATQFDTLGNDPLATTNGSKIVTVTHTAHGLRTGDSVTISGVPGAVNNIPAIELNTTFTIGSATTNTYTVTVSTTNANATGSGGGAAVQVGTGKITVTQASHGYFVGMRLKLAAAADTGGILAANINIEHVIRTVPTSGTYVVFAATNATSAVSAAGGAATTVATQIAVGADLNVSRTWSFDRFDLAAIICPGKRGKVYTWSGDTTVAPVVVTNSPAEADIIFVSNGKIVVLGAYSTLAANYKANRIKNSNTGDTTDWTITAGSKAYEDVKEGVDSFIGHVDTTGFGNHVLFATNNQIFRFDDIGGDDQWDFRKLNGKATLFSQRAADVVNGVVFFTGQDNLYMVNGDTVYPLPNFLMREYVFNSISIDTPYTVFTKYQAQYDEIWFYYSEGYIIHSLKSGGFIPGTTTRQIRLDDPPYNFGINSAGTLSQHDMGTATGVCNITTNFGKIGEGDLRMYISGMEPDSTSSGSAFLSVYTKERAQSTEVLAYESAAITSTTEKVDFEVSGRYRKYDWLVNNSFLRIAGWKEFVQPDGEF